MKFFLEKQRIQFHVPLGPFYCTKLQKKTESRFEVMRTYHFWAKMTKLPQRFSEKLLIEFPCLTEPFSLCKTVKQSLKRCEDELRACAILGPKWPNCPK